MSSPELLDLLTSLANGERSVLDVERLLSGGAGDETNEPVTELRIDQDRQRRCGYPEVIFAPGKSDETLTEAFARLLQAGAPALATRCDSEQAAALMAAFPEAIFHPLARTVRSPAVERPRGRVCVVTAGTSDRPVAEEAMETLHWMSVEAELLMDVGVAGPQRLLDEKHRLEDADAVVVVAGMEGALPSVVGGWVSCPVFAVPTSVGYGTHLGGWAALLGMLNSCAANVAVVNIDAGFKAAFLAGMIARRRPE